MKRAAFAACLALACVPHAFILTATCAPLFACGGRAFTAPEPELLDAGACDACSAADAARSGPMCMWHPDGDDTCARYALPFTCAAWPGWCCNVAEGCSLGRAVAHCVERPCSDDAGDLNVDTCESTSPACFPALCCTACP